MLLPPRTWTELVKPFKLRIHGITPGSGVGNVQFAITEEALKIPVIAIGIPTVVGVPTIVEEAIQYALNEISDTKQKETLQNTNYMKEILESKKFDCMVTPKDIDEMITNLSEILANGINKAFN